MHAPTFSDLKFSQESGKQAQLYQYLVDRIMQGSLTPGTRLPSSRNLAQTLVVGRNTIIAVVEQLIAEGFLTSHVGRGTFVSNDLPMRDFSQRQNTRSSKVLKPRLSQFSERIADEASGDERFNYPFTLGLPDLHAFPQKLWSRIARRHLNRTRLQAYDSGSGYAPLREALAEYLALSRGVICDADQVIITQGAQQAIYLCCLVFLNAGDQVLMENPGYQNAFRAFKAAGADIKPVPVHEQGIDIDALKAISTELKSAAKLLYCTPTHQYPLGSIIPAGKRIELLDWATENNSWIIEDDYDSEFHFHGKPIHALQGMANPAPVLYTGSFSKTLFPALRTGYLVVPKHLVSAFCKAKMYISGESHLTSQATIADFISEGHFVTHLRKMRTLYHHKWQHLEQLIGNELEGKIDLVAESAGMHVCLDTPNHDDGKLSEVIYRAKFGCTPLSSYYLKTAFEKHNNEPTRQGLVIGFSNTTEQDRIAMVKLLSRQ